MALTSRLVAHIQRSVRVVGVVAFVAGAIVATAVVLAGDPPARARLQGVGNRFENAAMLPKLEPARPLSFLVIGGEAGGLVDALDRGLEAEPGASFALLAGDLAAEPIPRAYDLLLDRVAALPARPPVFCLRGRHEAGADGVKIFSDRFGRRVFHFMYGDCLFLFLDNADGEVAQPQIAVFDRLLDVHGARWRRIFAFVHRRPEPGGEAALVDFCERRRVDAVIAGCADSDARERRGGTEWVSIGAKGATAVAYEIDPSGELHERVVARGVGSGPIARAVGAWRSDLSHRVASRRGLAFGVAAALLLGGVAAWIGPRRRLALKG